MNSSFLSSRRMVRRAVAVGAMGVLALGLPMATTSVYADDDGGSGAALTSTTTASSVCSTSSHGLTGSVTVTNSGKAATQGLSITAYLTQPPSYTPVASTTVDVSSHPTLAPGESHTYSFSLTPPAPGTYQVTTVASVTNGRGADSTAVSYATTSCSKGGITAARVGSFTVLRHASSVIFHWTASRNGITGFALYAGGQRLNAQVIPAHLSTAYKFATRYNGRGHFSLHVMLTNGKQVIVAA